MIVSISINLHIQFKLSNAAGLQHGAVRQNYHPLFSPRSQDVKLIDISRDNGGLYAVTPDFKTKIKRFPSPDPLLCGYNILYEAPAPSRRMYLLTLRANSANSGNRTSDRNLRTIFLLLLLFHSSLKFIWIYGMS